MRQPGGGGKKEKEEEEEDKEEEEEEEALLALPDRALAEGPARALSVRRPFCSSYEIWWF